MSFPMYCFPEWFREEDNATEEYGEQVTTGTVCHAETGGIVCGKLGRWLGFHRSYEVNMM